LHSAESAALGFITDGIDVSRLQTGCRARDLLHLCFNTHVHSHQIGFIRLAGLHRPNHDGETFGHSLLAFFVDGRGKFGIGREQLTVHADRSPAMTSKPVRRRLLWKCVSTDPKPERLRRRPTHQFSPARRSLTL
jgi:hypothetical protein